MNDALAKPSEEFISQDLPMSVLLFYTAMYQNVPMSEFAQELGIGALSLRQFICGQAQRPRGRTLELISKMLDMPVEEVRRRTMLKPTEAPSFSEWIQEKMMGDRFSRARLTRETKISDGALRNYISGQTLPDTDQARRLADTLGADILDVAKIVVSDHLVRNGGEPTPLAEAEQDQGKHMHAMGFGEDGTRALLHHTTPSHASLASSEEQMLLLWRKLHPQGRRATLNYMATLLAEE